MSKCPITKALNQLKRFAGLPVPEIVEWVNGKPDFRLVDPKKWLFHYQHKLCAICGKKLSLSCYWVGGALSKNNHYFTDGPMHELCAKESIKLCPFLNGTRLDYRGDLPHDEIQVVDGRPEKMYLLRGYTSAITIKVIGTSPLLWAGKELAVVREF